jgi:hypothetical protein
VSRMRSLDAYVKRLWMLGTRLGNQLVVKPLGGVSPIFPMYLLYQQHHLALFSLQYLRRWRGSRRGRGAD